MRYNINPITGREDIERTHLRIKEIYANYDLLPTDEYIGVTGDYTITLHNLVRGRVYYFQKTATESLFKFTIATTGAFIETSQGEAIVGFPATYRVAESVRLVILWADKTTNTWKMQQIDDASVLSAPDNYDIKEDYLSNPAGSLLEFNIAITAGANLVSANSEINAAGVANWTIGAGATSSIRTVLGSGTIIGDASYTGARHRVALTQASVAGTSYLYFVGYVPDNTTDFDALTNFVGFLYDNQNESTFNGGLLGNWLIISNRAGVVTLIDTFNAATTAFVNLSMQYDLYAGRMNFYIYDVLVGNVLLADLPDFAVASPQLKYGKRMEKDSAGGSPRSIKLDYDQVWKRY